MSNKDKVIEAFRNSEDQLNATKVSEISGVEKKEVDKIMKELKKDETIVSPKRCYWILAEK
jgi:predicted transcriptional regulator